MTPRPPRKLTSKKAFTRAISAETNIAPEVVQVVLEAFQAITIETLVNGGFVSFPNLFTAVYHKPTLAKTPRGEALPPRRRLTLRLSETVRTLRRLQEYSYGDKPYFVNRANWEAAVKWARQTPTPASTSPTPTSAPISRASQVDGIVNPFLDEDDELA